jgi:hypothetical protein
MQPFAKVVFLWTFLPLASLKSKPDWLRPSYRGELQPKRKNHCFIFYFPSVNLWQAMLPLGK